MKLNKILIYICLLLLLVSFVNAESYYVSNPNDCPTSYKSAGPFPNEVVCGENGGVVFFENPSLITAPTISSTSNSDIVSGESGGYFIDCYQYSTPEPYCMDAICDRDDTCYDVNNKETVCTANLFDTSTCGDCLDNFQDCDSNSDVCEVETGVTIFGYPNTVYTDSCLGECSSGYQYCDGSLSDGDGCEIETGVTSFGYPNTVYGSSCSGECSIGYQYCDGSYTDVDGCEVETNVTYCTIGNGAEGTYSDGCICTQLPQEIFYTNTLSTGFGNYLLWGNQTNSTGWLANLFTNNYNFVVNSTGVYFNHTLISTSDDDVANYLRLDGDNDPFQGNLDMGNNTIYNVTINASNVNIENNANLNNMYISGTLNSTGFVFMEDIDGEYHHLNADLTTLDKLVSNTFSTDLTINTFYNLTGKYINITSEKDYIGVELSNGNTSNSYIIRNKNIKLKLFNGTDSIPVLNRIYCYLNNGLPEFVVSTNQPPSQHAMISRVLVGNIDSEPISASLVEDSHSGFTKRSQRKDRRLGLTYISGLDYNATADNIHIGNGIIVNTLYDVFIEGGINITSNGFLILHQNGLYQRYYDVADIDKYSNDELIGNNKYFNIMFGFLPYNGQAHIFGIIQGEPNVEYTSVEDAFADTSGVFNIKPADDYLSTQFIPIARVIVNEGGDIQELPNGLYAEDYRGGFAGGVSSGGGISEVDPLSIHKDGNTQLTGDWNTGNFKIYGSSQFNSTEINTITGNINTANIDILNAGQPSIDNSHTIYSGTSTIRLGRNTAEYTDIIHDSTAVKILSNTAGKGLRFGTEDDEALNFYTNNAYQGFIYDGTIQIENTQPIINLRDTTDNKGWGIRSGLNTGRLDLIEYTSSDLSTSEIRFTLEKDTNKAGINEPNPEEILHIYNNSNTRLLVESGDTSSAVIKVKNDNGEYGLYTNSGGLGIFNYGTSTSNMYRNSNGRWVFEDGTNIDSTNPTYTFESDDTIVGLFSSSSTSYSRVGTRSKGDSQYFFASGEYNNWLTKWSIGNDFSNDDFVFQPQSGVFGVKDTLRLTDEAYMTLGHSYDSLTGADSGIFMKQKVNSIGEGIKMFELDNNGGQIYYDGSSNYLRFSMYDSSSTEINSLGIARATGNIYGYKPTIFSDTVTISKTGSGALSLYGRMDFIGTGDIMSIQGSATKTIRYDNGNLRFYDGDLTSGQETITLEAGTGFLGLNRADPTASIDVQGRGTSPVAIFDTDTGNNLFWIIRNGGGIAQGLSVYVDDGNVIFNSTQDENAGTSGGFEFIMDNDGTAKPYTKFKHGGSTVSLIDSYGSYWNQYTASNVGFFYNLKGDSDTGMQFSPYTNEIFWRYNNVVAMKLDMDGKDFEVEDEITANGDLNALSDTYLGDTYTADKVILDGYIVLEESPRSGTGVSYVSYMVGSGGDSFTCTNFCNSLHDGCNQADDVSPFSGTTTACTTSNGNLKYCECVIV